jgi:hypothetical protein
MKYQTSTECTWLYLFESKLQFLLPQTDVLYRIRGDLHPARIDVGQTPVTPMSALGH